MSKFIINLQKYWNDLEESYGQFAEVGETRLDYLKRLIGYKEGRNSLDAIKSKLMDNYEGNETFADALAKVFDALAVFPWAEQESISNLNDFVQQVVSVREEIATVLESELSQDLLDALNPYSIVNDVAHVSPSQQLVMHGTVMDTFTLSGDNVDYSLVDGFSQPGFMVFKSSKSEGLFVQNFDPASDMWANAYKGLMLLGEKTKNPFRCAIVTKDHYTRYAGELRLSVDKERYPLQIVEEVEEAGKRIYTHCVMQQSNEELNVICLG